MIQKQTVPAHVSSRFLSRIALVFFGRTAPASSIAKPTCIMKTKMARPRLPLCGASLAERAAVALRRAWREYAGSLNPLLSTRFVPAKEASQLGGVGAGQQPGEWYTFVAAHVCVFVADARTRRAMSTPTLARLIISHEHTLPSAPVV